MYKEQDDEDEGDEDYEEESKEEESDDDESVGMNEAEGIKFMMAELAAWMQGEGGLGRLFRLINGPEEEEADPEPLPDTGEMHNWLLPGIPLDPATSFESMDFNPRHVPELGRGAWFKSKVAELQIAMGLWCLKQEREVKATSFRL